MAISLTTLNKNVYGRIVDFLGEAHAFAQVSDDCVFITNEYFYPRLFTLYKQKLGALAQTPPRCQDDNDRVCAVYKKVMERCRSIGSSEEQLKKMGWPRGFLHPNKLAEVLVWTETEVGRNLKILFTKVSTVYVENFIRELERADSEVWLSSGMAQPAAFGTTETIYNKRAAKTIPLREREAIGAWTKSEATKTHLQTIEALDLSSSDLTLLPPEISLFSNVQVGNFGGNRLSHLPASFGQLSHLTSLVLRENRFSSWPEVIFKLNTLQTLDVSLNPLKILPDAIGNLNQLKKLELYEIGLSELPTSLSKLNNLQRLALSENQIRNLPGALISSLTKLETLYLNHNQLSELPPEIGACRALTLLSIEYNRLATLPKTIANLGKLTTFFTGNNPFTVMPEEVCRSSNPTISNDYAVRRFLPEPSFCEWLWSEICSYFEKIWGFVTNLFSN